MCVDISLMCAVNTLCPVYFISLATMRLLCSILAIPLTGHVVGNRGHCSIIVVEHTSFAVTNSQSLDFLPDMIYILCSLGMSSCMSSVADQQ